MTVQSKKIMPKSVICAIAVLSEVIAPSISLSAEAPGSE